jgi:hypothetical protein
LSSYQRVGLLEWYKDNRAHRDGDLPARIWGDGRLEWYREGQLHRDGDLPARTWLDGTMEWCQNGEIHRDGDLPARIGGNGTQEWWRAGRRHRDEGPALIREDGTRRWFRNDVETTEDGVAIHTTYETDSDISDSDYDDEEREPIDFERMELDRPVPEEGTCNISLLPLDTADGICYCHKCTGVFNYKALQEWLDRNLTCPCCREVWTGTEYYAK